MEEPPAGLCHGRGRDEELTLRLPLDDQEAVELEKRLHLSFGGYVGRMGIAKWPLNRRDLATPVQAGACGGAVSRGRGALSNGAGRCSADGSTSSADGSFTADAEAETQRQELPHRGSGAPRQSTLQLRVTCCGQRLSSDSRRKVDLPLLI